MSEQSQAHAFSVAVENERRTNAYHSNELREMFGSDEDRKPRVMEVSNPADGSRSSAPRSNEGPYGVSI